MDISGLSETELKALAYDQLKQVQACQQNLNLIEDRISRIREAIPPVPVKPSKAA